MLWTLRLTRTLRRHETTEHLASWRYLQFAGLVHVVYVPTNAPNVGVGVGVGLSWRLSSW